MLHRAGVSRGPATRDAAQAALDAARAEVREGADPSLRITTGDYLEGWIKRRVDLSRPRAGTIAGGVDISVVQGRLGHSTGKLTRDTYTSVLAELARGAADTVAAMIPRKSKAR